MSVPGIDEYVYGTDKLVEIRGASGLLDLLNRLETTPFLVSSLGEENVSCVFAGGGEGQFIIEATPKELQKALQDLNAFFVKKSRGGLRLYCGAVELEGNSYQNALAEAFIDLQREQDENPFSQFPPLHTGFIRECDSCSGILYWSGKKFEEDRILCKICEEKVRHGRDRRLWGELKDYLHEWQKNVPAAFEVAPNDFEEIGELCEAKRGYTALVYADGNGMTSLVRRIENEEQFRFFSQMIDLSLREACYEAIYRRCPPVKTEGLNEERIPCDILLLGGDDLLLYMSADTAFPFAIDVANSFYTKTEGRFSRDPWFAEALKGKGLTLSFGIAYGKSHTPFSIMFRQARELLKSAKTGGNLDPRHQDHFIPTYIDYHLTSYFNQLGVEQSRKMHLRLPGRGTEPVWLYRKPYSLEDAEDLLNHAKTIVRSGIPRSRLKRLSDAPSLGKVMGSLELIKAYTRSTEEDRRILWNFLERFDCTGDAVPWSLQPVSSTPGNGNSRQEMVWKTVLVDLIELTELISRHER